MNLFLKNCSVISNVSKFFRNSLIARPGSSLTVTLRTVEDKLGCVAAPNDLTASERVVKLNTAESHDTQKMTLLFVILTTTNKAGMKQSSVSGRFRY